MKRIAIVDDELDNVEVLGEILRSVGYETCLFTDPLVVAQSPLLHSFDLLIMDPVLHGIDGYELFKRVRVIEPTVPMVVLSGCPFPESIAKASATGFLAFFPKPIFDRDSFCRAIGKLIN